MYTASIIYKRDKFEILFWRETNIYTHLSEFASERSCAKFVS